MPFACNSINAFSLAISSTRALHVSCLNLEMAHSFFVLWQIWFNFKPHKHIYQKIAKERKKEKKKENHAILHQYNQKLDMKNLK